MFDKGSCDKGFVWNPSNCECECDKPGDVGFYLDYEYCKCRKRLVDKLGEECSENIDEVKMAKITLAEHKNGRENVCKFSCTLYIVLFSIVFTINIGIGTYFIYYKYTNLRVKDINIKHRRYYFLNDMIDLKDFDK